MNALYNRITKHNAMKEVIKGLIEYAKNPKYSDETGDYISDGEMLDILIEQLEKLVK